MSGVSEFSAVTSGFGWARAPVFGSGWTSGTSQTQLSKIAAPPTKKSYRNALFLLFLAPFIGPAPFAILERIYGVTPVYEHLAQTLVEIDQADESDWIAAEKTPSTLVEQVLRRYLADHGQSILAEHFELSLTLGEAIVDSVYGEAEPTFPGQLFFVLDTESSFALGVGDAITEMERVCAGMGQTFYDTLRQSLYRWIRVYDDLDARERIEQMTEWAEGEDDPVSYEIPKLEQDLPPCLADKGSSDSARPLASFPVPAVPRLRELVETTIEMQRISHSIERPRVDEEWLERERHYHSLDLPLPAVLLHFRAGDAVMACFDDECEYWGQETPGPNLIIPVRPDDPASVCQALAVIETLMQVLVLTVRIKSLLRVW
jgi:hypothetical protein